MTRTGDGRENDRFAFGYVTDTYEQSKPSDYGTHLHSTQIAFERIPGACIWSTLAGSLDKNAMRLLPTISGAEILHPPGSAGVPGEQSPGATGRNSHAISVHLTPVSIPTVTRSGRIRSQWWSLAGSAALVEASLALGGGLGLKYR